MVGIVRVADRRGARGADAAKENHQAQHQAEQTSHIHPWSLRAAYLFVPDALSAIGRPLSKPP
jgi:hypothetical protein